ncbi:hypothetical protein PQ477_12660 [Shouchella hunanensis]|uniref:Uncharacterized protein n=1 Tax=Shouchella hunanensis TaxID=766894 RepID=A0ABY7W0J6_9BACI|nr:hypothetical protein [Shouchella hunanensis]WDF02374.1 hypothetical protein PQ477_12660 [Shouchella hunanensis]
MWLAVNAGFAAYDGYKAYKAGKGWRGVGGAVASAFGPGKYVKGAKAALGFAKRGFFNKQSWGHIKQRHMKGRDSQYSDKGLFKNNRTAKHTSRSTLARGKARPGNKPGTIVYEKKFKKKCRH